MLGHHLWLLWTLLICVCKFCVKGYYFQRNVLRWDCFQGYFCYGDDAHKVIVVSWSCFFWLLMFKCEVCEKGFLLWRKLSLHARDHYRKGLLFLQIFWQHICSQFETHSKLYYIIYTCGLFHCDRIYCVSLNDVTLKLFFHNVANRWFLKNFWQI